MKETGRGERALESSQSPLWPPLFLLRTEHRAFGWENSWGTTGGTVRGAPGRVSLSISLSLISRELQGFNRKVPPIRPHPHRAPSMPPAHTESSPCPCPPTPPLFYTPPYTFRRREEGWSRPCLNCALPPLLLWEAWAVRRPEKSRKTVGRCKATR